MPTIDLTDDKIAAVVAAIRRVIDEDKFPHARALSRCARRWRRSIRVRHRSACLSACRYLNCRHEAEGVGARAANDHSKPEERKKP